jgi:hypothetical protein
MLCLLCTGGSQQSDNQQHPMLDTSLLTYLRGTWHLLLPCDGSNRLLSVRSQWRSILTCMCSLNSTVVCMPATCVGGWCECTASIHGVVPDARCHAEPCEVATPVTTLALAGKTQRTDCNQLWAEADVSPGLIALHCACGIIVVWFCFGRLLSYGAFKEVYQVSHSDKARSRVPEPWMSCATSVLWFLTTQFCPITCQRALLVTACISQYQPKLLHPF